MANWSGRATSLFDGRAASFFDDWKRDNATAQPGSGLGAGPEERPRRRSPRIAIAALLVAGAATGAVVLPGSSAGADPSASTWQRLRMCESSDNYRTNTGNGHYGAYQFDVATWRSVGGSGLPSNASKAEQDARALMLYRERGWQPWQCAGILGLHDDKDARSGRISDIKIGGSTSKPATTTAAGVPGFPGGKHWYVYGENSKNIKTFQNEMHKRGYFPAGTGQYGPQTRTMVKQLQRLNGLPVTGYIGPNTWRLAWTGTYHK